ncbi:large conductance mechanosensitive channel protein MscL [Fibrella forsythiae]|uniref:Large-conductance mechanosensitive channel n=1 Tax=Fibrella forsythiae TaxID=2817061 RepID=A0ABS3JST9_9BACT|nr:large conductance mechanosensitive channel protein MscL [Fibrella forsythiae]MBO0952259.1 large conductance mechanosensitive channel protein MscL [Fibrella forsythiae]
MIRDFAEFIKRGNALDLAVGVLIGAAFGSVVTSLTENLLSPLVGLALGGFDLSDSLVVSLTEKAQLKFGAVIQTFINFLITAFVIFWVVRLYNRLTGGAIGVPAPPPGPSPTEELLAQIRDELRKRPL